MGITVEWDEIFSSCFVSLKNRTIVEDFERQFANYLGTEYAVSFSDGRICLLALLNFYKKRSEKREVIVPAYTCIVVPNVILQAGLKPVFVDIELGTYGPDPVQVIDGISGDTLAVMPTHMFGQVCDIEPIVEAAKDNGVTVIEDAALALGASRKGIKAGCFGDVSFFSLNVVKNISTFNGGVAATNNKEIFKFLKDYQSSLECPDILCQFIKVLALKLFYSIALNRKVYGVLTYPFFYKWKISKFSWRFIQNWNIDRIEEYAARALGQYKSALGLSQLSRLDWLNDRRREIAKHYNSQLQKEKWLALPKERDGNYHVYTYYPILLRTNANGDSFLTYLASKGVRGAKAFSYSCPSTPALRQIIGSDTGFPRSFLVAKKVITLPTSPFLDNQVISYISDVVLSFRVEKEDGR
jgi:dTDP-4-amino-4,6-dideoxygalactose transaminase